MDVNPIEVQKALGGLDYPVSKDDIVSKAESSNASDDILEALRGLPDKSYERPTDVSAALG